MARPTISTVFKADDRVTSKMKAMRKSVLKFSAAIVGAAGLAAGVRFVGREFLQFDQALTSASAKFGDLNLATKEGQQKLKNLEKIARQVGATTKFSATEAAQGLDFLAMAGFSAEQSMVALPGVANLAIVAQTDLATATDMASDALGAFGMMTDDTAQLQENFTKINDVMAKTMTTSNTNMEQLFESIKMGAPAFTAAGQSLESFNALVGVMASSGVKGAQSGVQIRNIMLKLAKPTGEAASVLKKLGVETQDADGNFRDIIDILADFEKGLDGMGSAQQSAALATIFGARNVTGMNLLLKKGSKNIRVYRKEIEASAGASKKMADIIGKSLLNRLAGLRSAAIEVGFQFFDKIDGQAGGAIDKLTQGIRNINIEPLLNIGRALGPSIQAVIKIAGELTKMFTETEMGQKIIRTLATAFDLLKTAIEIMWRIAKPIIKMLLAILEPVLDAINLIMKGIDAVAIFLSKKPASGQSMADYEAAGRARLGNEYAGLIGRNDAVIQSNSTVTHNWQGVLDIKGAPVGSTYKQKGVGPNVNLPIGYGGAQL